MATHGGRKQLQRDHPTMRCADVASACERLAAGLSEGRSEARMLDGLRQAGALCRTVASGVRRGAGPPRALWSRRLHALAQATTRS